MSSLRKILGAASVASLNQSARPFRADPPGAREAFLLLHGFTGQPYELCGMAAALVEAGYAVSAPRYPGHGTCRADILATRAEDWLRRAVDAYLELRADYPVVHCLGHSMGGLIAAALAAAVDAPRLVLLAPAFLPRNKALRFAPLVAPFLPVVRRGREPGPEDSGPGRAVRFREYASDDLVAPAAGLWRLVRLGRRSLPGLRSEVLVLVGDRDGAVDPAVADFVKARARRASSVETRLLAGAGHLFPFDDRAGEAAGIVSGWLRPQSAEGASSR